MNRLPALRGPSDAELVAQRKANQRQDQAQAAVGLALCHKFGVRRAAQGRQAVQASTLVALAFSLGGVSKVW